MDYHLDKNIATNQTRYFFSILGPRFEIMSELMASSLSRRFGYDYKPIYIFSSHPNKKFARENYIVINEQASNIEAEIAEKVVYLQEYEDLNKEFMRSPLVNKISDILLRKQDRIPIYSFTTSFLEASDSKWLIIGPSPKIATYYDNKIRHYELFQKLNLPRNRARIFENKRELLKQKNIFPSYITASYTSGGNESGLIYNKAMLEGFLSRLRSINGKGSFLVADIFEHIVIMPNVNAIVTDKNKTSVLVISDQIMRGTRYLGNVYPSAVSLKHIEQIKKITVKIGNHLSQEGYRGVFGCDFLINDKEKLVIVDLNPRRQGGYACNALALKSVGIRLTDIELSCALGETPKIDLAYEKIQYKKAWAHLKVKPSDPGQRINREIKKGSMMGVFSKLKGSYHGTFYTKNSIFIDGYIGYVVETGKDRKKTYALVTDIANKLLDKTLS